MRLLLVLTAVLGSFQARAAQDSLASAAGAIQSLKETQACSSFQASVETEQLDGEFFSQRQVQFLKIGFVNPYGQNNVMYSKGDVKIVQSGKVGQQQESISFALDPLRDAKGGVHDAVAAELIHDGKGNLLDLRIQRNTGYLNGKSESDWSSVCKKRN
jgi:hypothetical protein